MAKMEKLGVWAIVMVALSSCAAPQTEGPQAATPDAGAGDHSAATGVEHACAPTPVDPNRRPSPDAGDVTTTHQAGEYDRNASGLTPGQIQKVVYAAMGNFRACYECVAKSRPDLRTIVRVSWRIKPDGSVEGAAVEGPTTEHEVLDACVVQEVRLLAFPRAGKGTSVSFPFSFRPEEQEPDG